MVEKMENRRTSQGFKEWRVLTGWIFAIPSCPLKVGPIGNVFERGVVVTILQMLGVQNARTAAGVNDIIKTNHTASAVVFACVGRWEGSAGIEKLLGTFSCHISCHISCPIRVSQFDGVDLDAIKGLRSKFRSMPKDQLVCLWSDHIPRIVVFVLRDKVGN